MNAISPIEATTPDQPSEADLLIDLLLNSINDNCDHPEVWSEMGGFVTAVPDLPRQLADRRASLASEAPGDLLCADRLMRLSLLHAAALSAEGHHAEAARIVEPIALRNSQSILVQGALFHIRGQANPDDPRYDLRDTFCTAPFEQLDVLERSSHQCCASWLHQSAGDMSQAQDWREVWNSPAAQSVRASVHDGSYRYCNKIACPKISAGTLASKTDIAARAKDWQAIVTEEQTELDQGPVTVNLAYDRTCNLSCPSCRTEKYAADSAMRARYDALQSRAILPMLKHANTVFITGSGDPFASKNFRNLMQRLGPDEYPDLRFQVMTNAMLLDAKQWALFPALHRRTSIMKISVDAATGPTHEKLRRGARWDKMVENLAFAGELSARGEIDHLELVFVAQAENYREMGDAVDLANQVGADGIYFCRLTNWGTFSDDEFARMAVTSPDHPDHDDFLHFMQDPRLSDPKVLLGDLQEFVLAGRRAERIFTG